MKKYKPKLVPGTDGNYNIAMEESNEGSYVHKKEVINFVQEIVNCFKEQRFLDLATLCKDVISEVSSNS